MVAGLGHGWCMHAGQLDRRGSREDAGTRGRGGHWRLVRSARAHHLQALACMPASLRAPAALPPSPPHPACPPRPACRPAAEEALLRQPRGHGRLHLCARRLLQLRQPGAGEVELLPPPAPLMAMAGTPPGPGCLALRGREARAARGAPRSPGSRRRRRPPERASRSCAARFYCRSTPPHPPVAAVHLQRGGRHCGRPRLPLRWAKAYLMPVLY